VHLQFPEWDWPLTVEFLICSFIGMGIGIRIASGAPDHALRTAFAVVVLGVAVAITWEVLGHH
jgi:uncharacterized membrane protein YfcA